MLCEIVHKDVAPVWPECFFKENPRWEVCWKIRVQTACGVEEVVSKKIFDTKEEAEKFSETLKSF